MQPGPDETTRLQWVQRNRTRRRTRPAQPVGPVLADVLGRALRPRPRRERELLELLWEQAGPELMDHVLDVEVRAGVLRLSIAEPAVRYRLRMTWEERLVSLLREGLPQSGVSRVVFGGPRTLGRTAN